MKEKLLFLDCPTGLAGDMLLAALLDLGVDEEWLLEQLRRLKLPGWHMNSLVAQKNGLAAHQIIFQCPDEHTHRHLSDILTMIKEAQLPAYAGEVACRAFILLAKAEAAAHGCTPQEVHFHEVGAADAILDICGVALAIDNLGVKQVYCSALPLSSGFVECAHGRLPLPVPATLNLLLGYSFYDSGLSGELITPTGAALLCSLKAEQTCPPYTLEAVGLGAGQRDLPLPNIARAFLGSVTGESAATYANNINEVVVLTANMDDADGEMLAYLLPLIMEAGALDACYIPLMMKKGRPAWQLQVICPPILSEKLTELIFLESSTLGLRIHNEQRRVQNRVNRTVRTPLGEVRVKISSHSIKPEFEDVACLAKSGGLPFKEVYRQALQAVELENKDK
ncbi:MAG: nickel pincer cofactor biosynthesis protein LarC [Clostridiales bacterium]|nr:nickel pincer cofactor biosynthesis protein LarC [Clostridiales bacterium]